MALRKIERVWGIVALLVLGWSAPGVADQLVIETAFNYGFASSALDAVAGATYGTKLTNPLAAEFGIGVSPFSDTYFGAYAEYWSGKSSYEQGGVTYEHTLKIPVAAVEAGYLSTNPRVFKMIAISVGAPVASGVQRTGGATFRPESLQLAYRARIAVGFRIGGPVWLVLRGGYRLHNFGRYVAGGETLTPSGAALDLSGVFLGAGLAVSL